MNYILFCLTRVVSHVNIGFKISWDPECSDDEIELKIKQGLREVDV